MTLLRAGLLENHAVALAGPAGASVVSGLRDLGARLEVLAEPPTVDEDSIGDWARQRRPLRALVYDSRDSFGSGGSDALVETMHRAWSAVREVAVGGLIDNPEGGKVILIGPGPDAGPYAQAAAAALENLARTLSVEWARYGVSTVMVGPGAAPHERQLGELVAFLCSPAGDYFSGCRLDLGGISLG